MGTPARSSPSVSTGRANAFPFRVVIVEDSAVIRGMMARWLSESDDFEVVARYGSASSALNRITQAEAEIVILDVDAEKMDGKGLLSKLLERDPTFKVLAVTTSGDDKVIGSAAMKSLGAAKVLVRSSVTREVTTSKIFRQELLDSSLELGRAYRRENKDARSRKRRTVQVKVAVKPEGQGTGSSREYTLVAPSAVKPRILAVGSSTGGPKALYEVFSSLKGCLSVPVVITQHMPPMFTSILAEHLTKASGTVAKEGEHGERVRPGYIYVAPGDQHMVLVGSEADLRIELNQGPEENFCRPSVDPMFRSVAKIFGQRALCLMLTGMGQDGCEGSKEIVKAGGTVVAQDEETSVVWGMPGAVAKAGLCAEILPLTKIGPRANSFLKGMVK